MEELRLQLQIIRKNFRIIPRFFPYSRAVMIADDEILTFDHPVILVGAAPVQIGAALEGLPGSWPLIAADGGADALLALGRRPDLVIGDMDSAGPLPDDLPRLQLSGQDDTDFEKCLARVNAPFVAGLGFLEGRFDHTLAAVHALMALPHDRPVMLFGATDVVLRLRGDIAFDAKPDERVSVWPLGAQMFHGSTGLKWPLDGLRMAPGKLIGTSNLATGGGVRISAGAGDGYAVIMPREAAQSLIDAVLGS